MLEVLKIMPIAFYVSGKLTRILTMIETVLLFLLAIFAADKTTIQSHLPIQPFAVVHFGTELGGIDVAQYEYFSLGRVDVLSHKAMSIIGLRCEPPG